MADDMTAFVWKGGLANPVKYLADVPAVLPGGNVSERMVLVVACSETFRMEALRRL
jgi:hypothetical protein